MDRTTFAPPQKPRHDPGSGRVSGGEAEYEESRPDEGPWSRPSSSSEGGGDPWVGEGSPEPGIAPYIRLWRQYRTLILVVMGLSLVGSVLRIVFYPRVYMATATILPSGGQTGAGMLGLLASMTGVPPVVSGETENSSSLFPRILESRAVSVEVLQATYQFVVDGVRKEGTLIEYLQARNIDEALLGLKGLRAIDVDKETGVIGVSVRTSDPELSAVIANRSVEALEKFNNEGRREQAVQNSQFIQERLDKERVELSESEAKLADFKEQNLRMTSPELEMELMRLTRDVTLKSQVFVTLSNQAEVARVEEAKNIPIVRPLDEAVAPTLPVPAPKLAMLVGGVLLGGVFAVLLVAGLKLLAYIRLEARRA